MLLLKHQQKENPGKNVLYNESRERQAAPGDSQVHKHNVITYHKAGAEWKDN